MTGKTETDDFDNKINEIIAKTCPGSVKVYCDNGKIYDLKEFKYPLEKYVKEQYYKNSNAYIGRCYVYHNNLQRYNPSVSAMFLLPSLRLC